MATMCDTTSTRPKVRLPELAISVTSTLSGRWSASLGTASIGEEKTTILSELNVGLPLSVIALGPQARLKRMSFWYRPT